MIAVIDYRMGNLHSVSKGLETMGADVVVTNKAEVIIGSSGIVLPGVGSFYQGMKHLADLNLIDLLTDQILVKKKPFLGICLGMQLCALSGEEYGSTKGLGWIEAEVQKFSLSSSEFKVPHMGWNDIEIVQDSPLFQRIKKNTTFYFVHSYHFIPKESNIVTSYCDHGGKFVASISKDNIHLVQFHPEKSQDLGLQILENFSDLCMSSVV